MELTVNQPFDNLLTSVVPIPAWWISRLEQIQDFLDAEVDPLQLRTLATSPGSRSVRYVTCGQSEPHLHGLANFNSALGASDPNAYCRRGERRQPVLVVLAGVHGAEVEGMMAALSAISIVETGVDLAGNDQAPLAEKLRRLRLIVIPLANPDGRARGAVRRVVGPADRGDASCQPGHAARWYLVQLASLQGRAPDDRRRGRVGRLLR